MMGRSLGPRWIVQCVATPSSHPVSARQALTYRSSRITGLTNRGETQIRATLGRLRELRRLIRSVLTLDGYTTTRG